MIDSVDPPPFEDLPEDFVQRPRALPGGGCFCAIVLFAVIVGVYLLLGFEPMGLFWQLPTAILGGVLISRSLAFTQRRRLVALGCALAIGITFLGAHPLLARANQEFEKRLAAQDNPVFGLSRGLQEWMQEGDSPFKLLAVFALPFALILDVVLLPATLIESAGMMLQLLPFALPATAAGVVLTLPGVIGLRVLNRRRLEEQAALAQWEESQEADEQS